MQMLLDLVVNIICKNVLREVRIWHPLLFIKFLRSPNQFCTFNIAFIGVVHKLFIPFRFRCVLFMQIRFLFVSGWCESFWTALSTAQECDTMIQEYLGETQAKPNQPVLTWSVNCWAGVRTETVYLPAFCYQCDIQNKKYRNFRIFVRNCCLRPKSKEDWNKITSKFYEFSHFRDLSNTT